MGKRVEKIPQILLMEDDIQNVQEISDTLLPAGYELHYSIAGHNFTEMIFRRKFDLVLFNTMIEGLNGFDILKKIKGSRLNQDTPLVFITELEQKRDLIQGLHVTGIDFLKIPYKREELLTRVNNQITMLRTNKKLEQSRSVTKSIQYAERIQKAMAPPESTLGCFFTDHFLINLPRDIVSGDFYWARKVGHLKLIAVADCTGHGVPGAFLSVLGISLLNEICARDNIENASGILETLRTKLKTTLLREDTNSPLSDGMDIALILIDTENMTLQFAGAFNRILISRNGEIIELRGDRQPIGAHPVEESFTNHHSKLENGDIIYMTTDGYVDQFGGEKGKKFQYSNFKELIRRIDGYDMQRQNAILLKEHMDWKGINDQVDDILMLGMKI